MRRPQLNGARLRVWFSGMVGILGFLLRGVDGSEGVEAVEGA